jgi:hypothetical protein
MTGKPYIPEKKYHSVKKPDKGTDDEEEGFY